MPEVFNRTMRVIVGLRFNVDAEVVVIDVLPALLAMPRASCPASVKVNVLEGSETSPVASKLPASSGNNVIPCAASNLTASSKILKHLICYQIFDSGIKCHHSLIDHDFFQHVCRN